MLEITPEMVDALPDPTSPNARPPKEMEALLKTLKRLVDRRPEIERGACLKENLDRSEVEYYEYREDRAQGKWYFDGVGYKYAWWIAWSWGEGVQYGVELDYSPPRISSPGDIYSAWGQGYRPPDPEEVLAFLRRHQLSAAAAAVIVGVGTQDKPDGRTVRRWYAPKSTRGARQIPYAAWRLLVLTLEPDQAR